MEKPTIKQRIDGFAKFLWNPETKEVMGRGARSWGEIGLFYLIYYACLAAFFAATIAVFYQTIDPDHPKLQGSSSLLKANPGMGFQPMPDIDTTLVRSTKDKKLAKHITAMTKSISKILAEYKNESMLDTVDCTDVKEPRLGSKSACGFNFAALTAACNEDNNYGMKDDKPCVLLKLNRIYGWAPQVWEADEVEDSNLPDTLKSRYTNDRVWVDCQGENPADQDNIGLGQIKYYPMQGYPLAFYPFLKQKDYRSPLIFVQFENVTRNLALMVECKAYAKNIEVDRTEKEGSVHFELLSDP